MSTIEPRITTHAAARRSISEFIGSGDLRCAVEDARNFVASDAYVHPNGFWKLRIVGGSLADWQVRLHYWPSGAGKGDIHDHGWAYASVVLHGSAVEDVYAEGSGEVMTAHSYAPVKERGFSLGWTSEETLVEHLETTVHATGAHSGGDARHIHTFHARPGSDLLTVVLTGEPVVKYSRVFLPGRGGSMREILPAPLSLKQIDFMLALAQASLDG